MNEDQGNYVDEAIQRFLMRIERDHPDRIGEALQIHNITKTQWKQLKKAIGNHYDR